MFAMQTTLGSKEFRVDTTTLIRKAVEPSKVGPSPFQVKWVFLIFKKMSCAKYYDERKQSKTKQKLNYGELLLFLLTFGITLMGLAADTFKLFLC